MAKITSEEIRSVREFDVT